MDELVAPPLRSISCLTLGGRVLVRNLGALSQLTRLTHLHLDGCAELTRLHDVFSRATGLRALAR